MKRELQADGGSCFTLEKVEHKDIPSIKTKRYDLHEYMQSFEKVYKVTNSGKTFFYVGYDNIHREYNVFYANGKHWTGYAKSIKEAVNCALLDAVFYLGVN